jgi:gliding motility-associated-like protein
MFKKIIITLYLFGNAFSAYSQAINRQINFTITSASYNQALCSGGVPKFNLTYRVGTGSLNSHFFTTSGTVCNSDVTLTGFSQTFNNFCDNDIEFNLTGWYERGGNASAFDAGIDTNLGENLSFYINPRSYSNSASIPITLSNGNIVTFSLTWSNTASTITMATGGTTCRGVDNIITLQSSTGGLVNFRWYQGVSGGIGTGPFHLGSIYTMPKSNYASGSNYEYYAAEVVSSACEKAPQYQNFSIVDAPAAPAPSTTSFAICSGNTVTIPISNYIAGNILEGYYDATFNTKAGPDVISGDFVTYIQNTNSTIYFRTKNPQGCYSSISSSPVTITVTAKPTAPRTADLIVCAGTAYSLSASNPNFPINYIWKDVNNNILRSVSINQLNDEFSPGQGPGTYQYLVQNSVPNSNNTGQCFSDNTAVKLIVHAIPPAPVNISSDTICEGSFGELKFNPVGAVIVKWYENASDVSSLQVGNAFYSHYLNNTTSYYATQTINNCESPKSSGIPIIVVPPLAAPQVMGDTICQGKEASISMNHSDSATQYLWYDNMVGGSELAVGRIYRTPILDSTTSFYAMYRYGNCYSNRSEVIVTVNPSPKPMNYGANSPCEFDTLKMRVDSLPDCTYSWLGTNNGFMSSLQNPFIENAIESDHQGEYQLIAKNILTGCESKPVSVFPDVVKKPDNILITHNSPKCETETIQLDASTIIGATYQWWGPNGYAQSFKNPTIPKAKMVNQGVYKLQVTIKGCKSDTVSTYVDVYPNPKPNAGKDTFMYEGDSVRLMGSGGVTYNWTTSPFLDFVDVRNPLVKPNLGFHMFELTVYDDRGCKEKDSVFVTVYPRLELNIKDVITPNGDGLNDKWKIDFIQNHFISNVKIFSLSGHIVYQSDKYENDWSGEGLPGGDYFFIVTTVPKTYKGTITLVK